MTNVAKKTEEAIDNDEQGPSTNDDNDRSDADTETARHGIPKYIVSAKIEEGVESRYVYDIFSCVKNIIFIKPNRLPFAFSDDNDESLEDESVMEEGMHEHWGE